MSGIKFFETVFDEQFCKFLLANARSSLADSREYARSNFHWHPEIRKSSSVILVRDIEPVLSSLILQKLVDRKIIDNVDYSVMGFAWTRLSYIAWHDDNSSQDALTIYLNEDWERDWGGLFLYQDDAGQILGYAPKFNCGLRNKANVLHATTMVALDAPEPRFTLQLFGWKGTAGDESQPERRVRGAESKTAS